MTRAVLFFELVRLRRSYYTPLLGCVATLCFAGTGGRLWGDAAIVGPYLGFMMLLIFLPSVAFVTDAAYPFLRLGCRSRVLMISWITAATYGLGMLMPAALLAAIVTRAAGSRTELLLAGTTFALGLSVRVPVSFDHAKRLIPLVPALLLSFMPGIVAALRGPRADPHAYAMGAIALDLLFIPICAFLTARAWRRADL